MNISCGNIRHSFRFRRWSRAGYAVFHSLSVNVTIGRVCKSICEMSYRKSNAVVGKPVPCALYVGEEAENEAELKALLAECQSAVEQMPVVFTANPAAAVIAVARYIYYLLIPAVGSELVSVPTAFFM